MQGYVRTKTRTEAQKPISFVQKQFGGGENSDTPASQIREDQLALLENVICFPDRLEARSGTKKYSTTALPGSGTVHALIQHPTTKKIILHRGTELYTADSAIASWTTVTEYAHDVQAATEAGDASNQISDAYIVGANSSNTNAGVLYWDLLLVGMTRTVRVYKTNGSPKTNLVMEGNNGISDTGTVQLLPQNNSGLYGAVTINWLTGDTDTGNTLTVTIGSGLTAAGCGADVDSTIKPFNNDAIIACKDSSATGVGYITYINLTDNKFYSLNAQQPVSTYTGSGTQGAGTPYGYRYLFTFCRITNTSGTVDYTKSRVTGSLVQETGSTSPPAAAIDYSEFWIANAIAVGTPNAVALNTYTYVNNGDTSRGITKGHFTHVGLYRTLDIGTNGTDPVTGLGNNREIYVWVGDYAIGGGSISDATTDDTLRSRFQAGFGLKSRFFDPLINGEAIETTPSFLFAAKRGQPTIRYSQLVAKELAGQYRRDIQYFKADDGVQLMAQSPDILSIICSRKTYTSAYGNIKDAGLIGASAFVITHFSIADYNIGVSDYGSFTETKSGVFIAVCSDRTVREWNRFVWGPDLSLSGVNKIIQQLVDGSTAAFTAGAYYLWYRTSTGPSYNSSCLRLGLGGNAGQGWTRMTGTSWIYPGTYTGAYLVQDSANIQKLIVLDSTDSLFYFIPPFLGYSLSLTSSYVTDKVDAMGNGTAFTCKIRSRDFVGDSETLNLFHEESVPAFRVITAANTTSTLASVTYVAYTDGNTTTAIDSITVTAPANITFFKKIQGNRLQFEIQISAGGWQMVSWRTQLQAHDVRDIGHEAGDTTEAANQLALSSNLTHWLCQPYSMLNRATGLAYTLAGTAPTQVTGANGKTYAISFPSGASYTQSDTTSYTDFSVCFWISTAALNSRIFNIDGPVNDFFVRFTSNTVMDVNGNNVTVASIGMGFHNFWIVRSGTTVTVYQNGASVGTVTETSARGGIRFQIDDQGGAMIFDDIRVYTAAKSAAAIAYYYSDMISNAGKKVLPLG